MITKDELLILAEINANDEISSDWPSLRYDESTTSLLSRGLIKDGDHDEDPMELTVKGKLFVEHLLSITPSER